MYHAHALEDLLDLINLAAARAASNSSARQQMPAWRHSAQAMLYWLRFVSHPVGGIALFNDAADGIAPSNAELEDFARRLGLAAPEPPAEGVVDLMPSGYVRAARGPAVAVLDLAPVGPDILPGHAHADTLAFELSLHGRRVVVNGGTSCYGSSAQRLAERGTAWHSTVQLSDGDSSEVWSGFRVGRRARVVERGVDGWAVSGCHDGWRALPGSPRHRRRWTLEPAALVVDDEITPAVPSGIDAVARYHLAPGLALVAGAAGHWQVLAGGDPIASVDVEVGAGAMGSSLHAPRFGVLQPAQMLVVTLHGGRARTRWLWNPDAHPVPD